MKFLNEISKEKTTNKIILVGKGPSVDKLNLKFLNKQQKYDIMAISDTIKLFKNPKFSIHYHIETMGRARDSIKRGQNVILNSNFLEKDISKLTDLIDIEAPNVYFFNSKHIKLVNIINQNFDLDVEKTLFNFSGSVVGCINFLYGYMGYDEIYYVGFDGGIHKGEALYSDRIYYKRKQGKIEGCKVKYWESWQGAVEMTKHYKGKRLLPLQEFLLK